MEAIDKAILLAARAAAALAAAACAAIFALVFLAVVMRYAVHAPFRFTEELSGLLLAMIVVLAVPHSLAAHENIRVTLLTERLSGTAKRVAWVIGQLIVVAFCLLVLRDAWGITEFTLDFSLRSENARLTLGPWMIAFTASFAVAGAIAAWQALRPPPADKAMVL